MGKELKDNIKEKIERYKLLADNLRVRSKAVFVKDLNYNIYFGDITLISKDKLVLYCFGPPQRKGVISEIYWENIFFMDEYKLQSELGAQNG